MRFTFAPISSCLLASVVLADSDSHLPDGRTQVLDQRSGGPLAGTILRSKEVCHPFYDCLAGPHLVLFHQYLFTGITGTITVPDPTRPYDSGAYALVTLDIVGCEGIAFTAGLEFTVKQGVPRYRGKEDILNDASTTRVTHFQVFPLRGPRTAWDTLISMSFPGTSLD